MAEVNKAALIDDVKLYLKTYASGYAKSAADEFTKAAKQTIIDVYYGNYTPEFYDRTEDLMNNSYYRYYKDNGSTMYGGVVISDRDMSDYINTWHAYDLLNNGIDAHGITSITPASKVVSWSWTKGYHGYTGGNPANAIYTFPPIIALEMEVGNLTSELSRNASAVAKKQKYSVLMF